jgi:hypothetical protein
MVDLSIIHQAPSKKFTKAEVQVGFKKSNSADLCEAWGAFVLWNLRLYRFFPSLHGDPPLETKICQGSNNLKNDRGS